MFPTILILTLITDAGSTIETINLGDGTLVECQAAGARWATDVIRNKFGARSHYLCSGYTPDGRQLIESGVGHVI